MDDLYTYKTFPRDSKCKTSISNLDFLMQVKVLQVNHSGYIWDSMDSPFI